MADEMSTIPPRVNALEKEFHTVAHRIKVLEEFHKDTPHRLTVLELAVERLPKIEEKIETQSDKIDDLGSEFKTGMNRIVFTLAGMGSAFGIWQIGPELLKFLGAR